MYKGKVDDEELWVRCWHCGDTPNDPRRCHCSINFTNGLYHCFRCGVGGRLPLSQYLTLALHAQSTSFIPPKLDVSSFYESLLPGPASQRFSALDRYHTDLGEDVFLAKDGKGETIGLLIYNASTKKRRFLGNRGLGYSDMLSSTPEDPLYLVEGPFDVMDGRYIASYGLPTAETFRHLRLHYIILYPDGDVWQTYAILQLARLVKRFPLILGAVRLPADKDPDNVSGPHVGDFISRDYLVKMASHDKKEKRWQHLPW